MRHRTKNNDNETNTKFEVKLAAWGSVSYDICKIHKMLVKGVLTTNVFRHRIGLVTKLKIY
jgi:hypothetical protein